MHKPRFAILALFPILIAGCSLFDQRQLTPDVSGITHRIYVVSNGWHAGLVLPGEDVPTEVWPEIRDLPANQFVEVGWGNEEFYMAPKITPAIAIRAMCIPSDTVLHVAGFNEQPEKVFQGTELIAIRLPDDRFREVCKFIHDSYTLDSEGQPIRMGPGLYGESQFYRARGKYFFPNTCNVWTAKALRSGGCSILPVCSSTALGVTLQARWSGERCGR